MVWYSYYMNNYRLEQMVSRQLNTPQTSSMGRLFDAVSALIGICQTATYDGEPAIALEAAIYSAPNYTAAAQTIPDRTANSKAYQFTINNSTTPKVVDPKPVILAILKDLQAGEKPTLIARKFHDAVAQMIVDICQVARNKTGIDTVAISGGVFMNRYLNQTVPLLLEQSGYTVLQHCNLPANDGCIAYGQAVIAAAQAGRALN
ncbi:hypothetical protein FACS1894104_4690 [Actinomycetota bacterium]|nr:hypothetical protein FACS1894104_4690 [Actinomycetota bacterium]